MCLKGKKASKVKRRQPACRKFYFANAWRQLLHFTARMQSCFRLLEGAGCKAHVALLILNDRRGFNPLESSTSPCLSCFPGTSSSRSVARIGTIARAAWLAIMRSCHGSSLCSRLPLDRPFSGACGCLHGGRAGSCSHRLADSRGGRGTAGGGSGG